MRRENMQYSVSEPFADVTRVTRWGQRRQAWIEQRMSELVRGRVKHSDLNRKRMGIERRKRKYKKKVAKAEGRIARNQELSGEDALRIKTSGWTQRCESRIPNRFDYEIANVKAEELKRNRDDLALLLKAGGDVNVRYKFEKIQILHF